MKYSKMEQRILDAMKKQRSKVWEVEQIAEIAYEEKEWPTYWNSSIAAIMRNMMLKTMHSGDKITRTSDLGRGNTATYTIQSAKKKPKRGSGGRTGPAAR